jgi:hypothetical protein
MLDAKPKHKPSQASTFGASCTIEHVGGRSIATMATHPGDTTLGVDGALRLVTIERTDDIHSTSWVEGAVCGYTSHSSALKGQIVGQLRS